MVPKTQWTIQDYLKHAGMAANGLRHKRTAESTANVRQDFSRVLADSQAESQKRVKASGGGRRIADYLKTPVVAKTPRSWDRMPSATLSVVGQTDAPSLSPAGQPATPEPCPQTTGPDGTPSSPSIPSTLQLARQPAPAHNDAQRIDASIEKAASDYDLPAELICGVIQTESNFKVRAVSPAGAQGLMQLMPATARELGVDDPFDIEQNIDGGARYLRQMLDMFGGDLKQALSAYNAGPGTVLKYDGHVPYPETRHYVRKVMLYAQK
jgi:hypothetical protein